MQEREMMREREREREGGWGRERGRVGEREREGGGERERERGRVGERKRLQHPCLNTQYTHASVSFKFPWVSPFELNKGI